MILHEFFMQHSSLIFLCVTLMFEEIFELYDVCFTCFGTYRTTDASGPRSTPTAFASDLAFTTEQLLTLTTL